MMNTKTKLKNELHQKFYSKEYEFFTGEDTITFHIYSVDTEHHELTLILEYQGRISQVVYQLLYNGKDLYFLFDFGEYSASLRYHIVPYFEKLHLRVSEIKARHLNDFFIYLSKEGNLHSNMKGYYPGLSRKSLSHQRIVLKQVLNSAVIDDLLPSNPLDNVPTPRVKRPPKEKVFLTADQANVLIRALDGHPLQGLIAITLFYGLRRSEALGLRWQAIDFEKNTLSINHTVIQFEGIIYKDTTKNTTSHHTYPLTEDVKSFLLKRKEEIEKNKEKYRLGYINSDYVFTQKDGKLFRPDDVTRSLQRQLKKAGLPKMTFHQLRHSAASILHEKGWELKDAQTWMRHADISVTADIYTHISEQYEKTLAKKMSNIIQLPNKED